MKKIKLLLLSFFLIGISLAACSNGDGAGDSDAALSETIRYGVLPSIAAVPVAIAESERFFEQHGLKVEVIVFTSAKDRDAALQTGELDGANCDLVALGLYNEAGFEILATGACDDSFSLITNESIHSISDLKGQDVIISTNTAIEYSLDQFLAYAGLSPSEVNKTEVPAIPVRLEMLRNDHVKAAVLPEPWVTIGVENGLSEKACTRSLGLNPFISVFTKESLTKMPQEIQAFYQACNDAVDYLNSHQTDDYIDVIVNDLGFPEEIRGNLSFEAFTKHALPREEDFNSVFEWLRKKGLVTKDVKYRDLISSVGSP